MSRLADDLDALAAFSAPGEGVTRVAWSEELARANEWLVGRMEDAGLTPEIDAAGNVIGKWQAGAGKAVLLGSHIDTVPSGGKYDGALGVLSALEAIRLLRDRGVAPARPVWLVAFADEEGIRFGTGMFGSRAFVGADLGGLAERTDATGVTLSAAMASCGRRFEDAASAVGIDAVGDFLEVHIEQGPVLEHAGVDVGIVTGIVGFLTLRVRYVGQANHAGTTPMEMRRDALVGAARAAVALRDEARKRKELTANVGRINALPGASNVVPGACEFSIDIRTTSHSLFGQLEGLVSDLLERIGDEERLELDVQTLSRQEPVDLDPSLQDVLQDAAAAEGASLMRMPSGAGHDAMILSRYVPTGMLFVPSRDGTSHSPAEFTDSAHCDVSAAIIARAVERLTAAA